MSDSYLFTTSDDPRAQPLLAALTIEYDALYGNYFGEPAMSPYPAEVFTPPQGAFLLTIREGETIAGGAFMRVDDRTAEIKRVWVHGDFRRQGLAREVLVRLEKQAREQGYSRLVLSTGFRQPAARQLYLDAGYTPLFDLDGDPEALGGELPFEKSLR